MVLSFVVAPRDEEKVKRIFLPIKVSNDVYAYPLAIIHKNGEIAVFPANIEPYKRFNPIYAMYIMREYAKGNGKPDVIGVIRKVSNNKFQNSSHTSYLPVYKHPSSGKTNGKTFVDVREWPVDTNDYPVQKSVREVLLKNKYNTFFAFMNVERRNNKVMKFKLSNGNVLIYTHYFYGVEVKNVPFFSGIIMNVLSYAFSNTEVLEDAIKKSLGIEVKAIDLEYVNGE